MCLKKKNKHVVLLASLLAPLLLFQNLPVTAQQTDSLLSRTILIGDAGEMDAQQDGVIKHAASSVVQGKTRVIFLGDNIYPKGMGLPGSKEERETQEIIRSQYSPFRSQGVPVYFVPGNHDWDRSGPLGLQKIKRQGAFLKEQEDSLLQMVPEGGCPGPVEIPVNDGLVVIAFDSEWWVFPHDKTTAGCACNTKAEVAARIKQLYEKNKGKVILLAAHHPFQSYGSHGGNFSWKNHIFPLTVVNKNLYIPLPVIGSLYPLLRTIFTNPEDLAHRWYSGMISQIDSAFAGYPDLVHVAGHDHGLQFIRNKGIQVVSGSGAKHSFARKGRYSLYASTLPGYVVADQLVNNYVRFTYYANTGSNFEQVFTYTHASHNAKSK